jgi:hypothetical protein
MVPSTETSVSKEEVGRREVSRNTYDSGDTMITEITYEVTY